VLLEFVVEGPKPLFRRFAMRSLLLALAAGVLVAAEAPKEDAGKKDLKAMQGTWEAVSHEEDGRKATEEERKKAQVRLVVKGDEYTISFGKTVGGKGTLKLDPGKKPKQIDVVLGDGPFKGKAMLGIYELKGDELRVCTAMPGKERPKEFSTKKGSQRYLIGYKRLKK
jgi:uncharacterized protein (TIGR03067 family)